MPAAYLHGVETIETTIGPIPVQVVRSGVIGLIGSAPMWSVAGAAPRWNQSWLVALGQLCLDANGNIQKVTAITTGITTVGAEPTWATALNATTVDAGATWTLVTLAAAAGLRNFPTLVSSALQAAAFGLLIQGWTIPYALQAIQQQGSGQVIVVNVFDQVAHVTAISALALSFPGTGNQVLNLGHMGVSNVKVTNSGNTVTYVLNTDFSVDFVNGIITAIVGGAITAGQAVKVTFNYADPTKVVDATIVGAVASGVYSGIQALQTVFQTMGFWPKILIAPGYSQGLTVAQALDVLAQKIRAIALVDSAPATIVATAIANRGTAGQAFFTSSKRTVPCYPQMQFIDNGIVPTGITLNSAGGAVQNAFSTLAAPGISVGPYSQWFAGVIAQTDYALGYWFSPSNKLIAGIIGPDVAIYASFMDPNADTNNLNGAGIVTVMNSFATGMLTWGNRSAAFPTLTAPDNFLSIRRTMDIVEESIQLNSLQFMDQPINNFLIDAILDSVNAFIHVLIQRGALMPGSSVLYNPADNPPTQIAAGQLVVTIDVMPPPPLERLTYNTKIDINLLANLQASVSTVNPSIPGTLTA